MTQFRVKTHALLSTSTAILPIALVAAGGFALSVAAQSYDTGGIQLTTGIELSTAYEDNRALDIESAGNSTEMQARLSFGLLSETRIDRLGLDFSGTLRNLDSPGGTSQNNGFQYPSLSVVYGRSSASTRLDFNASLRESELSQEYLDDSGLDYVTGIATRRQTNASLGINWGEDSSLGFGILARTETNSYRNGTATGIGNTALDDTIRRTLGATVRMDLDPVRRIDLGLTWSDFEQDSVSGRRETLSWTSTLTQELNRGTLTAGLDAERTEDGERYGIMLGRSLDMPLGQVSGQIGISRAVSGDSYLSGRLDLNRDLVRGRLSLGLSRAVSSSDSDDTELLRTRAFMGLTQEVTPVSEISVDLNLSRTEETDNGEQASNADFGITYSRDLARDWTLATGYTHRLREDDAGDMAHSNRIFLTLQRNFVTRF